PGGQCGNKAVQLAVEWNLFKNVAAIRFEGRPKIVDINPAELGHEPIRTTGRNAAQPEIIDALFAPAANDVVALRNFFQKERDVGRVVLKVAIHGDDVFTARMIESRRQSRSLPKIPA